VAEPAASAPAWSRRSAWAGLLPTGRIGAAEGAPGVTAMPRDGLGLATVIARSGALAELRGVVMDLHGIAAPDRPVVVRGGAFDLVWAGPEQWLAVSDGDRQLAARLAREVGPLAAVSDQSDARAVLRIAGPSAREALAKGCPIDLHSRAFKPGDIAVTAIAHVGVQLWQRDEAPTYELAVPRSMAGSFWGWLSASAAEFGLAIVT
jgi:methylglutamate dehydrogenase subunit D